MFDDYVFERYIFSGSPHTQPDELEFLARDASALVRKRVAENPNTPIVCLLALAADVCHDVRCAVAENPNAPVFLLEILASDAHDDVRFWLAENPNTPDHILEALCNDSNCYVAHRAKYNLELSKSSFEPTACDIEELIPRDLLNRRQA